MGLDNGIILKNSSIKRNEIPDYIKLFEFQQDDTLDICYWRKCWNIRHMILNAIKHKDKNNQGYYELTIENLLDIIDGLYHYICVPEDWATSVDSIMNVSSIWSFEEVLPSLAQDLVNLNWLVKLLQDPRFKGDVYFYDSY